MSDSESRSESEEESESEEGSEEGLDEDDDEGVEAKAQSALVREDINILRDIHAYSLMTRNRITDHLSSDMNQLFAKEKTKRPKKNVVRRDDNLVERALDVLLDGGADSSVVGSDDDEDDIASAFNFRSLHSSDHRNGKSG
mmetsp:Transcript_24456/g.35953  ORF Transcript_24456/g.35953 Transcript_24456/m.35953 type:complete len:141 (+) Transcript_24456:61-483(+)|eukprot:CAMPEP_0185030998 /NCGR_PEP_ID=MMETSP1103-20130426/18191_1 /TAXON_ID=36769 /ORGANISM="Paraphysomonas bandaiensis, Strain Caron Lab Isolate" /LENGTH=140 /DNA_ID=CAMNT_0027566333 /DNA_START=31 /DNA_END=453 /DNA_ORIENTATION=-